MGSAAAKTHVAKESRLRREVRETIRSLAWAVVLFLIIRTLAFQAFRIPSPSMEDTLLIHDFLFISKLTYGPKVPFTDLRLPGLREPEPGDVVVFKNPQKVDQDYIKRCVAVGGQTVEYRDKVLYVDGVRQVEPYVKHTDPRVLPGRDNFGPFRVPEGKLFMMGDNRDNSSDSRYWGFLDESLIHGKAEIIYFSWSADRMLPRFKRLLMRIE
ncbi:MAG: signal peptidase I [Candidatus Eisenbacteria bacterium]|nr:signal peptidase I [Candidatus Latescibacterota bacterium]MBD3301027.1 signal peptidase I [Candidatus Eisenbacteria bacterium]